jgi:DNA-binding NtrC family response regulator
MTAEIETFRGKDLAQILKRLSQMRTTFLTRTEALGGHLTITQTQDSDDALEALSSQNYDLVITDVDMGPSSLNGFELVSELRKRGSKALVCVHANRIVAAASKTAIEVGANYFMSKPMARAQLPRHLRHTTSYMQSTLSISDDPATNSIDKDFVLKSEPSTSQINAVTAPNFDASPPLRIKRQ